MQSLNILLIVWRHLHWEGFPHTLSFGLSCQLLTSISNSDLLYCPVFLFSYCIFLTLYCKMIDKLASLLEKQTANAPIKYNSKQIGAELCQAILALDTAEIWLIIYWHKGMVLWIKFKIWHDLVGYLLARSKLPTIWGCLLRQSCVQPTQGFSIII